MDVIKLKMDKFHNVYFSEKLSLKKYVFKEYIQEQRNYI